MCEIFSCFSTLSPIPYLAHFPTLKMATLPIQPLSRDVPHQSLQVNLLILIYSVQIYYMLSSPFVYFINCKHFVLLTYNSQLNSDGGVRFTLDLTKKHIGAFLFAVLGIMICCTHMFTHMQTFIIFLFYFQTMIFLMKKT